MNTSAHTLITFLVCGVFAAGAVHAERADRDKPVNLDAAKVTIDDIKRTHVFEGNVVLTQGTLVIRSAKLVVTQDAEGFQKGVATGGADGLARFRQKRDGKDEYMDGEGERIEYDSRNEKAEFFRRAYVKSGTDEVRGDYITYDGITEQYLVMSAPGAKPGSEQSRVHAVIQPKSSKKGAATETPAALPTPPAATPASPAAKIP